MWFGSCAITPSSVGDGYLRLRLRCAVGLVVVPRHRVHRRFGEDRLRVQVVGVALRHLSHRVGEREIERGAVGRRGVGVARGERVDVGALALARVALVGLGLLERLPRRLRVLGGHRRVDVGAEREGSAPVAHRALGVGGCAGLERAHGLGVVERVAERQPLIEVALRGLRFGRDLVMIAADVVEERRFGHAGRARRRRLVLASTSRSSRRRRREAGTTTAIAAPCFHDGHLRSGRSSKRLA